MIPQFVPYWGESESNAVRKVLESDYLNEHKTVRQFEKEFAEFVGAKYCVTVTSGTIALYLAVMAVRRINSIERDHPLSNWLIPVHDGIFAFNALIAARSSPMLCDVDGFGIMDIDEYEMTDNIGSITVHANGRLADNVPLIEDCSQAVFHHTPKKISTYSFASSKHITTAGQGGAICCDDERLFNELTRLKDHGRNDRQNLKPMSDNYDHWGLNFKFTEIQAAFGLAQLHSLKDRMYRLSEINGIYYDILKDDVVFDSEEPKWYVDIHTKKPDTVKDVVASDGYGCRLFPKPLHMQPVAQDYILGKRFPNAEKRYKSCLYLPSSTNLKDEEVKAIAESVRQAVRKV